jgi:hypothetical protein
LRISGCAIAVTDRAHLAHLGEAVDHRVPHVPVGAEGVQEHERLTVPTRIYAITRCVPPPERRHRQGRALHDPSFEAAAQPLFVPAAGRREGCRLRVNYLRSCR